MAVIAGSGRLPVNVAAGLKAAGHPPFVIIVGGEEGEADELDSLRPRDARARGDRPSSIPLLKRKRITHVVLAGGIGRRPS